MATKQRKGQRVLSVIILIAMMVCAFFAWPHRYRHSGAWNMAFFCLLFLNSFINYRRSADKAAHDTLIRLFPKPINKRLERP
jgi:hypothetical protein